MFRIVGVNGKGVSNYDKNKVYPLVGATYANDILQFFFINDLKKLWWVNHEYCLCEDTDTYGREVNTAADGGSPASANNTSTAISAATDNTTSEDTGSTATISLSTKQSKLVAKP